METRLLIGGELVEGSGERLVVENPATEETVATIGLPSAEQLDGAIAAAAAAAPGWGRTPALERGEMPSHEEAVAERGQTVLRHATDQAQASGFEIETKMVKHHPVEALLAEAEGGDARMIVVGNQGGPSPLKGAILGAVPFKLVHLSPVPVLVVPPG